MKLTADTIGGKPIAQQNQTATSNSTARTAVHAAHVDRVSGNLLVPTSITGNDLLDDLKIKFKQKDEVEQEVNKTDILKQHYNPIEEIVKITKLQLSNLIVDNVIYSIKVIDPLYPISYQSDEALFIYTHNVERYLRKGIVTTKSMTLIDKVINILYYDGPEIKVIPLPSGVPLI